MASSANVNTPRAIAPISNASSVSASKSCFFALQRRCKHEGHFERYGNRLAQARHKQQETNRSEDEADDKDGQRVKAAGFDCP